MLLILAATLALHFQGPAPVDAEVLRTELLGKFSASKSYSATLEMNSVDAKGVVTPQYRVALHYRREDGRLHLEMKKAGQSGSSHILYENARTLRAWEPEKVGTLVDMTPALRVLQRYTWRSDRERSLASGELPSKTTFEEYESSLRPVLALSLDPTGSADGEAKAQMLTGFHASGGASWLLISFEGSKVTDDEVIVHHADAGRTTVIDRRTGWLRSVRLDSPSGASRTMIVTDLKADPPQPDVKLPASWTSTTARTAQGASMIMGEIHRQAAALLAKHLKVGKWDRPEAIIGFASWVAAEGRAVYVDYGRDNMATAYVRQALKRGETLDGLKKDLDSHADSFKKFMDTEMAKHEATLDQRVDEIRKELEASIAKAVGKDESRRNLVDLLREGFKPERVLKITPSRAPSDPKTLLGEAIEAAPAP